ncbi:flagellar hook-associated protein FlgL [Geochorda subterranea]|uniref:Flagellar hook-associated protein FlgL n=1 Tax=Geochorda subterranea TaxID=3109564 RepID=A0ABZ1BN65_9FIRM|nr:flagellar hook-associated protein FlgL [Limnochorda sp. LNt]WRP13986.1 flagellar hook-associated protein FlgL [Limnochorda sp. LNt]
MRISSRQIVDNVLINLHRNYARLDRLQTRLSSGKRVMLPSDDPAGAATATRLRAFVLDNEQYLKNAQAALGWLTATDSALQDVVSVLHRARELTINAARGDLPGDAREALASEFDQLIRHLVQVANTTHGGRYIFGGTQTEQAPYVSTDDVDGYVDTVTFYGNDQEMIYEIGPGVRQAVSVSGATVFDHGSGGGSGPPVTVATGLFSTLITIRQHISDGEVDQLSGQDLADLDQALDHVLRTLSRVGARQNGFELVAERLQSQEVNLKDLLSKTEDLDVAEAIVELKMQENVYRLALASGARIIQPTLLDFLR